MCSSYRQVSDRNIRNGVGGGALCFNLPSRGDIQRTESFVLRYPNFARAYLSNVCVARELHRNGVGYKLNEKSKVVAREWGITDMYVHVTVNNEAAKRLYMKSWFEQESAEPAWQALYLNKPQRLLLSLPITS
ncbi:unnamed protein product [Brassica napus]|uniref:(rape) hypothetical protein n=1 Tax=Brassica napus TaxID=3708 RepID=A0A816RDG5_BRANA|nr:unnamed protein product [Brassica napus]